MDFESRFEIKYSFKDFDEIFIKNILQCANLKKAYEDRIISSIYYDTNNFNVQMTIYLVNLQEKNSG